MWQTLWAQATSNAQLAARSVWHVCRQWGNNNLRGRNVTVAMAPTRKRTSKLFWYQHVHRYMKEESSETSTIAVGDLLKILSLISTGKGAFFTDILLGGPWLGSLVRLSFGGISRRCLLHCRNVTKSTYHSSAMVHYGQPYWCHPRGCDCRCCYPHRFEKAQRGGLLNVSNGRGILQDFTVVTFQRNGKLCISQHAENMARAECPTVAQCVNMLTLFLTIVECATVFHPCCAMWLRQSFEDVVTTASLAATPRRTWSRLTRRWKKPLNHHLIVTGHLICHRLCHW